jgi:hypothetical protein
MDYDDNETDEDLRIKGMTDKELDSGISIRNNDFIRRFLFLIKIY